MKKLKIAEYILVSLAFIAIVMNMFLIPSGAPLTVILLSTLSLLYLPYGFVIVSNLEYKEPEEFLPKNIPPSRILGGIGLGIGMSMMMIAILFKLMSWPGADIQMVPALILLVSIAIVSVMRSLTGSKRSYKPVFIRIAIAGTIGLLLVGLPRYALVEFKYRNYPEYIELLKKSHQDPKNKELKKQLHEERLKINS